MKKQSPPLTKILLVDDEPDLLSGLKRSFAKRLPDIEVVTAAGGNEALNLLEQQEVALVLMDIMMPVMDGIELIEKVRAENKDIIIIAITAVYSGKNVTEVLEKGADQCLTKPFDIPQLMLILMKFIMKRKSANAELPIFS